MPTKGGNELVFITVHNSSCEKVMYSQACVKNSVQGEECIPACTGADTPPCSVHAGIHIHSLGRHPQVDIPSGRHPLGRHPPAQCMLGYTPPCTVHAGIPLPPDSHCRGRYASYWKAFLFTIFDLRSLVFSVK